MGFENVAALLFSAFDLHHAGRIYEEAPLSWGAPKRVAGKKDVAKTAKTCVFSFSLLAKAHETLFEFEKLGCLEARQSEQRE